ncbi:hypothetical protein [Burkholderia ubonensis]|uniref:hypothetical protein n=1 Tax=Burkholderia ubonensis TaxID=101571 RepID=UPI000AA8ED1B|nr:hypothetical protein [Burkholderia ubonensis]
MSLADLLLPVESSDLQRQVSERYGHSIPSLEDKSSADAVVRNTPKDQASPSFESITSPKKELS